MVAGDAVGLVVTAILILIVISPTVWVKIRGDIPALFSIDPSTVLINASDFRHMLALSRRGPWPASCKLREIVEIMKTSHASLCAP